MAVEIVNIDEVRRVAAGAVYHPEHLHLIATLHSRYPALQPKLIGVGEMWSSDSNVIVDAAGETICGNWKEWLAAQCRGFGGDAGAVWERHKDHGLLRVETLGETLRFTLPYGAAAEAFFQVEIEVSRQIAQRLLFPRGWQPSTLCELLDPVASSTIDNPVEITPWSYRVTAVTNVRHFLREMVRLERERRRAELPQLRGKTVQIIYGEEDAPPNEEVSFLEECPDYLARAMKEERFFADWESSAGRRGERLCDHWCLDLRDFEFQGRRSLHFTPCLAGKDAAAVSGLRSEEFSSLHELVAALEGFDAAAGYRFAWYFYMLHGSKIDFGVGERVAEAVRNGTIPLPAGDAEVLLRWSERQYRF